MAHALFRYENDVIIRPFVVPRLFKPRERDAAGRSGSCRVHILKRVGAIVISTHHYVMTPERRNAADTHAAAADPREDLGGAVVMDDGNVKEHDCHATLVQVFLEFVQREDLFLGGEPYGPCRCEPLVHTHGILVEVLAVKLPNI